VAWRRTAPGPVAFTNGVFDILHAGHVTLLEACRARGGSLVVGLNSDDSVRLLAKGPNRPLNVEADRALLVAALAAVDCVVLFDEATPLRLIAALEPDLLFKGGDYAVDDIVGADIVRARGGVVATIPLMHDRSTTRLLERLRDSS
jgi:rfaE bifunctional protein nucleotidyltransferase chain/domain